MNKEENKLKSIYSELRELVTPSGHKVTIRLQNGEDDDILTNGSAVQKGDSTSNFIRAIVVKSDFSNSPLLTAMDMENMKLCDKYFIIIASRIFSLGATLVFDYDWGNGKIVRYEEELNAYIWDYSNIESFPKEGDPDYYRFRIKPHIWGKDQTREISLSSGKVVRYHFSNTRSETYLMSLSSDKQFKNQELLARGIALKENDTFVNVKNFKPFSSFDMLEIRRDIEMNDPNLEIISEVEDPHTNKIVQIPILGTPDFFFPREI